MAQRSVPACVWAVADFVKRQKCWQGTATELLAAAGITDVPVSYTHLDVYKRQVLSSE